MTVILMAIDGANYIFQEHLDEQAATEALEDRSKRVMEATLEYAEQLKAGNGDFFGSKSHVN